jgi:hypothetical protein
MNFRMVVKLFFSFFSGLCLLRAGSWIAVGANSRGKTTHSSGYSRTQQRAQPHRMHVLLLLLQAGDGAIPCLGIRQSHTSREDRQGIESAWRKAALRSGLLSLHEAECSTQGTQGKNAAPCLPGSDIITHKR